MQEARNHMTASRMPHQDEGLWHLVDKRLFEELMHIIDVLIKRVHIVLVTVWVFPVGHALSAQVHGCAGKTHSVPDMNIFKEFFDELGATGQENDRAFSFNHFTSREPCKSHLHAI